MASKFAHDVKAPRSRYGHTRVALITHRDRDTAWLSSPIRIGFSFPNNLSHNAPPPPLVSSRPRLSEWYMDEFGRSSGVHNGSTGLAFDAVLRRNCDAPDHYRRHTPDIGDGLLHARGHGPIESRQNFSHRSRLGSPECRTAGNSTARLHLPLHVRPMPNLQTPHEPSLPNLQPLRQSNGPSLPLDE